jgi:hypothetical protein
MEAKLADPATADEVIDALPSDLELVREAYGLRVDCTRIRETSRSIRRFLELLSPEVELAGEGELWEPCRGKPAATQSLVSAALNCAECSFALEDVREPDPGHVLACGTVLIRPAGSSEVQKRSFTHLWTISDGAASRVESLGQAA